MHTRILPTAVTKITTSKIMLIIMACNGGNDNPESKSDDEATVAVLVPNDDDNVEGDDDDDDDIGDVDGDDCVDSSFVPCVNEAIDNVRLTACVLNSSNFKCSIQIDK